MSAALSEAAGHQVELIYPQRGENLNLFQVHCEAGEVGPEYVRNRDTGQTFAWHTEAFDLDDAPKRIEVFDNSHIQGAHAVGAMMIVSGPDGF